VSESRIDPTEEIPEADLLEQQTPLAPDPLIDTPAGSIPDPAGSVVDEADRLDQQAVVLDEGEDDYPRE